MSLPLSFCGVFTYVLLVRFSKILDNRVLAQTKIGVVFISSLLLYELEWCEEGKKLHQFLQIIDEMF